MNTNKKKKTSCSITKKTDLLEYSVARNGQQHVLLQLEGTNIV